MPDIDALSKTLLDQSQEWWLRYAAAESLGRSGDRDAIEPLIVALNDPAAGVIYAAIKALSKFKDQSAVEPLSKLISCEFNERNWVLIEAEKLLAKDKNAMAKEPEAATLRNGDIRTAAAYLLGELADARAVEALMDMFAKRDKSERVVAIAALRKIGDPRSHQVIAEYDEIAKAETQRRADERKTKLIELAKTISERKVRLIKPKDNYHCPNDGCDLIQHELTTKEGNKRMFLICHYCGIIGIVEQV